MASVHAPTIDNLICLSPGLRRDRRQHYRFPITAQAEYVMAGHRANATTLDIGSGGVLLKTGKILRIGQPIEVLIDWPVLLEERLTIRLVVFGRVIRSNGSGTAVGIIRYEFRVRAQNSLWLSA
jgi:PilZ domain-containing protein